MSLTLEAAVWITMKSDSIFGYFGINRNYFHYEGHEGHEEKSMRYPILPFNSFSNFMVKKQMLFVLS
jgi:hypothetical protein